MMPQPSSPLPPPPMQQAQPGKPSPDQIRQKLLALLTQAEKIAGQNGVDFKSVVAEYLKGKTPSTPATPTASPAVPSPVE